MLKDQLPSWAVPLVEEAQPRRFFLFSNGPIGNATATLKAMDERDIAIQFNTCRHHSWLREHRGEQIFFLHTRPISGEVIGLRRVEALYPTPESAANLQIFACYGERFLKVSDIEKSALLPVHNLNYMSSIRSAKMKWPKRLIPSIGFSAVSWLQAINLRRQMSGMSAHQIVLCGFTGRYSHAVFARHDFEFEQELFQSMEDLQMICADGSLTPFENKSFSAQSKFRNIIPDDFEFFRAEKSDLFSIIAKRAFQDGDTQMAASMARLAVWNKPKDIGAALRLLVDVEISESQEQLYSSKHASVLSPTSTTLNELRSIPSAKEFLKPLDYSDNMMRFDNRFGADGAYTQSEGTHRRAIIVNHTIWIPGNSQHLGCAVVSQQIERELSKRGIVVAGWINSLEGLSQIIQKDPSLDFDTVVINGEGTLHHGRPRAFEILLIGKILAEKGKSVHLVNSIWEENPDHFIELLGNYSMVSVRDRASATQLISKGIDATYAPDLSWTHKISTEQAKPSREVIGIQDCVLKDRARLLASFARAKQAQFHVMGRFFYEVQQELLEGSDPLRFPKPLEPSDFLTAKAWVTGRYHGLILALRHRHKVVSVASNTSKISQLLQEIDLSFTGIPDVDCSSEKDLEREAYSRIDRYPEGWEDRIEAFEREANLRAAEVFDRIAQG
ncbi:MULTISPECIES: polysaccharide pyruvyl transferase family protein [unclassified Ruegeria]|uniref:polysaccharide pyruvyl transferase family protein n=1 Tax=unclassified Ruegeria TaxID=2625375 RepID=UPI0014880C0A|nr:MULTISPECIES: polysaccharide pyruvyl transferase family protein [unclassified Ruegeria]